MGFAPGSTCDAGLKRDALAFGSGLKPDVNSGRWHSLQESAKIQPMLPNLHDGLSDLNHVLVEVRLGDLASGIPESVSPPGDRAAI